MKLLETTPTVWTLLACWLIAGAGCLPEDDAALGGPANGPAPRAVAPGVSDLPDAPAVKQDAPAAADDLAALRRDVKKIAVDMEKLKSSMNDLVSTFSIVEDLVKLTRRQVGENGDAIAGLRDHVSITMRSFASGGGEEQSLSPEDLNALVDKLKGMGVVLDPEAKTVTMEGVVATSVGPLEFAAVAEGGKAHESLFMLRSEPRALNAALLALGLEPGKAGRFEGGKPISPTGPKIYLYASWASEGKSVEHRIEDLIIDLRTQKPMARTAFVFHGSRHQRNSVTGKRFFAADITRDLVSTWNSQNTIIDNPRPEGAFDDSYVANNELMPPKGTPVKVVLRLAEKK